MDDFDKGGEHVSFCGPAEVDLVVENVGEGTFTGRGWVQAAVTLRCGRCLKPFNTVLDAEVDALFRRDADADVVVEDAQDALEAYPLRGHYADLAPALLEALVLEVPFSPLCAEDCAGLCPVCGADMAAEPCECEIPTEDPRLAPLRDWIEKHR